MSKSNTVFSMSDSINYELMNCQLLDDQLSVDKGYSSRMTKTQTMGDRINEIRGADSFATVSVKLAKKGVNISAQGVHKWTKGGEIPEGSLQVFCQIYSARPEYVRYGVSSVKYPIAEKIRELPLVLQQRVESYVDGLIEATKTEIQSNNKKSYDPDEALYFHITESLSDKGEGSSLDAESEKQRRNDRQRSKG
jgi:hypothetical protein